MTTTNITTQPLFSVPELVLLGVALLLTLTLLYLMENPPTLGGGKRLV